jgi:hypothetical protein
MLMIQRLVTLSLATILAVPLLMPLSDAKTATPPASNIMNVTSNQLVTEPSIYLNKKVQFKGTVSGFSAIGLDYNRIERSSKDYVSLVIYRDDVPESYDIPLSELKLFVSRKLLKELKRVGQDDEVSITGKVVSTALSDAWVDVTELKVLKSANPEKADLPAEDSDDE